MISVYSIKPKFQKLLRPVLDGLYRLGVTANMITLAAVMLSLGTGAYIWFKPGLSALLVLPISLFVRMALNALDGMMARIYSMQSKLGEVLNELGDVVSDTLMFFPLIKLFPVTDLILLAFLFLALINEFAGVLGKIVGGERRYDGPMGKSDRAFFIGLLSLLLYFGDFMEAYVDHAFVLALFLLVLSTGIRIKKSLNTQ